MKYIPLLLLFFLGACHSDAPKKQLTSSSYFDLKGYIDKQVSHLKKTNPDVDKSVRVNGSDEQKVLKIANWQKELAVFADADINKSAWQGAFKVSKSTDKEVYTSSSEKVPVKSLTIHYTAGKVKGIEVLISNANSLYTSNDTLAYFPDSLYEVRKTQHIKMLNEKNYRIKGLFK